jgi:hypothetical protein
MDFCPAGSAYVRDRLPGVSIRGEIVFEEDLMRRLAGCALPWKVCER